MRALFVSLFAILLTACVVVPVRPVPVQPVTVYEPVYAPCDLWAWYGCSYWYPGVILRFDYRIPMHGHHHHG